MNLDFDKVPTTVDDSIQFFIKSLTEDETKALKDVDEDQISIFHFSWGTYLRNYWSLWEKDTILSNSFKNVGITHPDDMTAIILTSAHRTLHEKPIKLKEQVNYYQKYWKKEIGREIP